MAKINARTHARLRPNRLLSAVTIGLVGAVGVSGGLAAPAAFAAPGYPSWDDVQKAKGNEATKSAEIEKISGLLGALRASAEDAATSSQVAAEAYRVTLDALDAATAREASLTRQASAAEAAAATSKMRAGLIAAHLGKAGAGGLSLNLFLNGNTADDLLHQLGTASKLSEQSAAIYDQALQDKNTAESLGDQAASASAERTRLTEESKTTLDAASRAATVTQAAFDLQQKKSSELFEQLALLKDTTAEEERSYQAGVDAAATAKAFAAAQASAARIAAAAAAKAGAAAPVTVPVSAPVAAPVSAPVAAPVRTPVAAQVAAPVAAPVAPPIAPPVAPRVAPPASSGNGSSSGATTGTPAPIPNANAVSTAISFARAQLGDRYLLGGAGPDVWDCSGLTRAAYSAAGIYIGSHSATNQYNTMSARGRLVSFANVAVGDLVFWGSPGNYYHVAIYMGGGQILEAPNPSSPVRIHSIWSISQVAPYVGRPA
ncbi:NlpC/P60 family protein [Cryobacterium psychrophilum]|uniref:NlpC/P60 family protein n=1 Tax=Cryobacterium psychrophilum TaxID=41988 RepID=A0A4Y8KKR0_9MICO|nr:C40 family peptidase [Cryobacterium psychrophilum]TDW29925.1 cell wall-associated NlpC family hydrolase [Cryobacterium psychrophilum]TFD76490.1 NlpC/P60 family protein [Cryobacterium psychrophilum]